MFLYLKIVSVVDFLIFLGVIAGSAVTEIYVCNSEPIPIPYLSSSNENETEGSDSSETIWALRENYLEKFREYGPEAYHILYILIWAAFVIYILVELWLSCVLFKAVDQKRKSFSKKWLIWRGILLMVTTGLVAVDIKQHFITCTDSLVIPFCIFRFILFFVVLCFQNKLDFMASTDTIIMIGSDKL